MKKLSSLFIAIFIGLNAMAQWATQISNSGAELRGIYFTSSTTGYAVGSGGEMVHTTDAGQNWAQISSGTIDTLRAIHFPTATLGFAVGANGTIIRTTDAGASWTNVGGVVTLLLRSVYFPTPDTGYICGAAGVILKSTDSGLTWNVQTSPVSQDLINIRFATSEVGYAVSSLSTFASGVIIKTTDGGNTWAQVFSDSRGILALAVPSDSVVYAGGNGEAIFRTTDAGTTWDTVYATAGSALNLRNGWFISEQKGYLGGDGGSVYSTSDGGNTWLVEYPTTNGVLGMHYYNVDTLFACGNTGTILRYTTPCTPDVPGAIIGPTVSCSAIPVTYTINSVPNATSYNWTFPVGSTIVSGQGDTSITVILGSNSGLINVSSVNNCGPSLPSTLSITVGVSPPTPGIIQTGQSLTSTVSGVLQWFLNSTLIPGATMQVYTPQQSGNYTVMVTGASGCTAVSGSFYFSMAGLSHDELFASISLVPNPSSGDAILQFDLIKNSSVTVKAFDVSGKEIFVKSFNCQAKELTRIDLQTEMWNSGIYFVQIETDLGVQRLRFLKQ